MYNVSLPYSVFGEIPTSSTLDSFEHAVDDLAVPSQIKTPARYHTRIMTAPNSIFYQSNRANNGRGRKSVSSILPPFTRMSTEPTTLLYESVPNNFISKTKDNYDFHNYLSQQQQALASLPTIDTNTRHARTPSTLLHPSGESYCNSINASFDDDLPPLTADIHTPGTQPPTEFGHTIAYDKKIFLNHVMTPDLMMDFQPMLSSIYDVFTPEEIQQPPEACIISPSQEEVYSPEQRRDYFCSMETSHISLLQQQLQLHNETASNIILNNSSVSNLLLLSSPPLQQPKKRTHDLIEHQDSMDEKRILTYSSNPSHITLSSNCSSTSSNCSINSDTANPLVKKPRYSP